MKILLFLTLWDQLFKINDVFVQRFVKVSYGNITNTPIVIFDGKCENPLHFSMQRILTFVSTKITVYLILNSIYSLRIEGKHFKLTKF